MRVHSLRKFFKTQMEAAGVKTDYVEYFMGHKRDTYHDIESLGMEKLRSIYANANLSKHGRQTGPDQRIRPGSGRPGKGPEGVWDSSTICEGSRLIDLSNL